MNRLPDTPRTYASKTQQRPAVWPFIALAVSLLAFALFYVICNKTFTISVLKMMNTDIPWLVLCLHAMVFPVVSKFLRYKKGGRGTKLEIAALAIAFAAFIAPFDTLASEYLTFTQNLPANFFGKVLTFLVNYLEVVIPAIVLLLYNVLFNNEITKSVEGKDSRSRILTYALVVVLYLVMQYRADAGELSRAMKGYLIPICSYVVLAISLNLVVGISGELSLGHAGFMGVGAFSGIVFATILAGVVPNPFLRLVLSMLGGGVIAGLAGAIVGIPVLRLRGDYLAIVTLAFGEILKNIISNLFVGYDSNGLHFGLSKEGVGLASDGKMIISGSLGATGVQKISTFFAGFLLILFTLFIILNLLHSKEGRAIKSIRDNRIAAESVGINVTAFKMKAFVTGSFLAGMAGALYGLNMSGLQTSKFGFDTSIDILVYVVMGGMGNIMGSVISTIVLYLVPELMRSLQDYRMILYAVVLIVVMLFTWSPKVKMFTQVAKAVIREKTAKIFGKKGKEADDND